MSSGSSEPSTKRTVLSLPGQPTEEALAEVGSQAGKSLLRGLSRLGNALVDKWATSKEAKAEAARLAIETDAKIGAENKLAAARRASEIDEFEHRATLQRRLNRLKAELAFEQGNWEAIESKAIEYTERDPENENASEIDVDWLFRFSDFAQRVSDKDIQNLWAKALSSASIEKGTKLSAASLQTLTLLDKKSAEDLKSFAAIVTRQTYFPIPNDDQTEPLSIHLGILQELGLIHDAIAADSYRVFNFRFGRRSKGSSAIYGMQPVLTLTRRGTEIARAVFRNDALEIATEIQQEYLRRLLVSAVKSDRNVQFVLDGVSYEIEFTPKQEKAAVGWREHKLGDLMPARLRALLDWADSSFSIRISGPEESSQR